MTAAGAALGLLIAHGVGLGAGIWLWEQNRILVSFAWADGEWALVLTVLTLGGLAALPSAVRAARIDIPRVLSGAEIAVRRPGMQFNPRPLGGLVAITLAAAISASAQDYGREYNDSLNPSSPDGSPAAPDGVVPHEQMDYRAALALGLPRLFPTLRARCHGTC